MASMRDVIQLVSTDRSSARRLLREKDLFRTVPCVGPKRSTPEPSAFDLRSLHDFGRADASFLHVRRSLSGMVATAAGKLSRQSFPSFDSPLRNGTDPLQYARRALSHDQAEALSSEIRSAVEAFRSVSGSRSPKAFFGIVSTDQCRKFHVDYIALRMVVTLHGPGTEWVPEGAVDRGALERFEEDPDTANRSAVRDCAAVQHCRSGDWLFMKGAAWPGRELVGAVHRSPPIGHRGERRVVLVLTMHRSRRSPMDFSCVPALPGAAIRADLQRAT